MSSEPSLFAASTCAGAPSTRMRVLADKLVPVTLVAAAEPLAGKVTAEMEGAPPGTTVKADGRTYTSPFRRTARATGVSVLMSAVSTQASRNPLWKYCRLPGSMLAAEPIILAVSPGAIAVWLFTVVPLA